MHPFLEHAHGVMRGIHICMAGNGDLISLLQKEHSRQPQDKRKHSERLNAGKNGLPPK